MRGVLTYILLAVALCVTQGATAMDFGGTEYEAMWSPIRLVVPEGYTSIRHRAFSGEKWLRSVELPSTMEEICESAFSDCKSLEQVDLGGVKHIVYGAFEDCKALESVKMTSSLREIGGSAFAGCTALRSVVIPESLTKIESYLFARCESLEHIEIASSVTDIKMCAFLGCKRLKSVTLKGDNFVLDDGVLYNRDRSLIVAVFPVIFGDRERFEIPKSVQDVRWAAFNDCIYLSTIVVDESSGCYDEMKRCYGDIVNGKAFVSGSYKKMGSPYYCEIADGYTSIANGAFAGCEALYGVTIPASVREIGEGAFVGCKSLLEVEIPGAVKSIEHETFGGCRALRSIVIPSSVEEIRGSAFVGCRMLRDVKIEGNRFVLGDDGMLYSRDKSAIYAAIPALFGKREEFVILPSVSKGSFSAFAACTNLATITMKKSHPLYEQMQWSMMVNERLFSNRIYEAMGSPSCCIIPEGYTALCRNLLSDNDVVQVIEIPSSVRSMGQFTLENCTSLQAIYVDRESPIFGDLKSMYGDKVKERKK
ncbi:MAG: leucine-rich repeat domain-containing protein [Rikenellaceae bacterium]